MTILASWILSSPITSPPPSQKKKNVHLNTGLVTGQVDRKSSHTKSCCLKPELCSSKFMVMMPDILSQVVQNFIVYKLE